MPTRRYSGGGLTGLATFVQQRIARHFSRIHASIGRLGVNLCDVQNEIPFTLRGFSKLGPDHNRDFRHP